MPLFPFTCKRCGKGFDFFLRLSDSRRDLICPFCNGEEVEEILDSEREESTASVSTGVCGLKQET